MKVEISNADLIDRITILELKMEFLRGDDILRELQKEYDLLTQHDIDTPHKEELKNINRGIWEFRDMNRLLHSNECYNQTFVVNARRIIELNNERVKIKHLINSETNSYIMNQKGYNTPISTPSPSYNSFGSLTNQLFL